MAVTASTRRAALGAILMAPVPAGVVTASPYKGGQLAHPSDLARVCEWAIEQANYINTWACADDWDDDRLDAEGDRYNAAFIKALTQPSTDLQELVAKARLCLHDFEAQNLPFRNPDGNADLDDLTKMVMTVLREVITLCA